MQACNIENTMKRLFISIIAAGAAITAFSDGQFCEVIQDNGVRKGLCTSILDRDEQRSAQLNESITSELCITNHSLQREERLEVPYHALREALINSLCHRQWEKHNLTGSIAIYDDRIEIANPGIFPPQISPESIKEPHESYPYNLKIAEALYKSTYLESWGSGAKRIMDACREQGVEEPTWRWDGGFVIVTFKRPTKNVAPQETIKSSGDENSIQTGYYAKEAKENPKETKELPKEIIDAINNRGLTDIQCNLLSLIITMPSITLSKMAEELDLTIDQVRTLRKKMENKGVFLCHKGATKKGTWEIKFE